MAQQIKIDIVADVQKLQQGVDQANKQLGGLDASVKKVQSLTTAFVGVGVAAKGFSVAGNFINETTDAASNLEETLAKTNELFGASTKEVVAFAKSAAKNLGQSSQQALDASANFAIFGKAAGLAGGDLVDFSTDFTVLASDLASFNNTSPQEAINAIGSALRGEAEPLRRYGVLLNDAALRQAALELGIVETTKNALTPQQKVLAAQKVIYEQTTAAQGDFARTSDGLANSTRILEAQQADLNASIGETFLPVMKQVNEIMRLAIGIFTSLPGPVQKIVVVVGLLVAVLGPAVILVSSIKTAMIALGAAQTATAIATKVATAAQFLFNAAMTANPIGLVILAIVALIAIIVLLVKNWDKVTEAVGKVFEKILEIASKIKDAAINLGKNFVKGLWDGIQSMLQWFVNKLENSLVGKTISKIASLFGIKSPSTVFAEMGEDLVRGLALGVNNAQKFATKSMVGLADATTGSFMPSLNYAGGSTGSAPIQITINAGMGTDPYALGREVNNALTKYGRVSSRVVRG